MMAAQTDPDGAASLSRADYVSELEGMVRALSMELYHFRQRDRTYDQIRAQQIAAGKQSAANRKAKR